jgi:hypothetical protein
MFLESYLELCSFDGQLTALLDVVKALNFLWICILKACIRVSVLPSAKPEK